MYESKVFERADFVNVTAYFEPRENQISRRNHFNPRRGSAIAQRRREHPDSPGPLGVHQGQADCSGGDRNRPSGRRPLSHLFI